MNDLFHRFTKNYLLIYWQLFASSEMVMCYLTKLSIFIHELTSDVYKNRELTQFAKCSNATLTTCNQQSGTESK